MKAGTNSLKRMRSPASLAVILLLNQFLCASCAHPRTQAGKPLEDAFSSGVISTCSHYSMEHRKSLDIDQAEDALLSAQCFATNNPGVESREAELTKISRHVVTAQAEGLQRADLHAFLMKKMRDHAPTELARAYYSGAIASQVCPRLDAPHSIHQQLIDRQICLIKLNPYLTLEEQNRRINFTSSFVGDLEARARGGHALPAACEDGHWVSKKLERGEIILLEDGSIWEIDSIDRIDTMLWLPTESVVVCPGYLINTDSGDKVGAQELR